MTKWKDYIAIVVSSVLLATIIMYVACLIFLAIGGAIHIFPQDNALRYNAVVREVNLNEILSQGVTFDFNSSPNGAEILLYGHIDSIGALNKNIVLKSEEDMGVSNDIHEFNNLDINGDPKTDGECAELFTESNFILKLEAFGDNSTFTYDIAVESNSVTLSGFSNNIQILLYSDKDIYDFPVTKSLESIRYEILNCSKISFKVHKTLLHSLDNIEIAKITNFTSFEINAHKADIKFGNETYPSIAGVCIPNKSTSTILINPLIVDINAELESAKSGSQNLMPNIWLRPLIVFRENIIEIIGAFLALIIPIVGGLRNLLLQKKT